MLEDLKRLVGFTLAETLITLGIIGIVASITIPTIMQNVQDQAFRSMFKKDYALLASAISQANYEFDGMFRAGNFDYTPIRFNEKMAGMGIQNSHQLDQLFMDKYLPIVVHCSGWGMNGTGYTGEWKTVPIAASNECWAGGSNGLNGASAYAPAAGGYRTVILNNGSIIVFDPGPISVAPASWGDITIDVNGIKSPNIIGRDRFVITTTRASQDVNNYLYNYARLIPYAADSVTACNGNSKDAANTGLGCAAKVIQGG